MYKNTPTNKPPEVEQGILSLNDLERRKLEGRIVELKGSERIVLVGEGSAIKVNANIGCSNIKIINKEYEKVAAFACIDDGPDTTMDLSIVRPEVPVYEELVKLGGPVGTLPHYLCFQSGEGIDEELLIKEVKTQAQAGVAWMTLHLTASLELYEQASNTRMTALTSRGGALIVKDAVLNNRKSNVLQENLDSILDLASEYGFAVSLGSTFRPSTVLEAMDTVHKKELDLQAKLIEKISSRNVPVILEAVGHMTLGDCDRFCEYVREELGVVAPIMPLGPISTDNAVGFDHVSNAIGGSYLAMRGGAHVLNAVTREEHTGGVPVLESVIEGIRSAKIAAHSVNISKFKSHLKPDQQIAAARAKDYTCVVGGEDGKAQESLKINHKTGCSRCGSACPLIVNAKMDQKVLVPLGIKEQTVTVS